MQSALKHGDFYKNLFGIFRQADEKYHNSQFPPEIASFFILEGSQEGEVCADIYNGVGNTLTASLLLNRKYIGIERNNDYYQQTCRKADFYDVQEIENNNLLTPKQNAA